MGQPRVLVRVNLAKELVRDSAGALARRPRPVSCPASHCPTRRAAGGPATSPVDAKDLTLLGQPHAPVQPCFEHMQ